MSPQPNNFSWIIEGKLAGSGFPFESDSVRYYIENGIKAIVNLSGKPSLGAKIHNNSIMEYNVEVEDFGIPSVEQIKEIWSIVDSHMIRNEAVVVHCIAGCGRTGTILATLVLYLQIKPTIVQAIQHIRELRPCSIETKEQMEFLINNF